MAIIIGITHRHDLLQELELEQKTGPVLRHVLPQEPGQGHQTVLQPRLLLLTVRLPEPEPVQEHANQPHQLRHGNQVRQLLHVHPHRHGNQARQLLQGHIVVVAVAAEVIAEAAQLAAAEATAEEVAAAEVLAEAAVPVAVAAEEDNNYSSIG